MSEPQHAHAWVPVTRLKIGKSDIGLANVAADDEMLTFAVRIDGQERLLRLRFASIDQVRCAGDSIDFELADGAHVSFDAPAELRDDVRARCRTLPELTRALRALGSSRSSNAEPGGRSTDTDEQRKFFAPFIIARRAAGGGSRDPLFAFDGEALTTTVTNTLRQFAADRFPEPGPERRALEAELLDASESLFSALSNLRTSASTAAKSADDLRAWRAWSQQLQVAFDTADKTWVALDAALDAAYRRAARHSSPRRSLR